MDGDSPLPSYSAVVSSTEEENDDDRFCLHLSSNKISFRGVSKSGLTNVFFDEANIQVFTIQSGSITEVEVRSPYGNFCKSFKIEEKGRVNSIKYSPDQTTLALNRNKTTIEFFTFNNEGQVDKEFSQSFKGCELLGYNWSSKNELLVITTTGVKLFKIQNQNKSVALLKSLNLPIRWFTYLSTCGLLLVKLTEPDSPVQLLQIKSNQFKAIKFDLYSDSDFKGKINPWDQDDVVLGLIYNKPRILFLNYRSYNNIMQTEVIVRTLMNPSTVQITNLLRIDANGRFSINIIDNLIIVHNQKTKTSMIFDITDAPFEGSVTSHQPLTEPMTIKPFVETLPSGGMKTCELYSPNWAIFQPNIITDVIAGNLWGLELNLSGLYKHFKVRKNLIKCLLLRSKSEEHIYKMLLEMALDPSRLGELSEAFDCVNEVYRNYLGLKMQSQICLPTSSPKQEEDPQVESRTVIHQHIIYDSLFCKIEEIEKGKKSKLLTRSLIEYIRSLSEFQIHAEHSIYKLLIKSLVMNDNYYQLYQLLQYHVIADSKPLACDLLSLRNDYPAALQLAIDMFERLGCAKEEITEILLSDQQVLPCLRYTTQRAEPQDRIHAAKYIDAAKATNNPILCYSIVKHFDSKLNLTNVKLKSKQYWGLIGFTK